MPLAAPVITTDLPWREVRSGFAVGVTASEEVNVVEGMVLVDWVLGWNDGTGYQLGDSETSLILRCIYIDVALQSERLITCLPEVACIQPR